MKKLIPLFIISFVCLTSQAAIYRVNNNPGTAAQYSVAQTAHNACNAGDTLYIEGSTISYGILTITKKINIIGPGYFLAQNPQTQVNPSTAWFNQIICNTGSAGTYLTGLQMYYLSLADNNIVLKRNYIINNGSYNNAGINVNSNSSNDLIVQNYITSNNNCGNACAPLYITSGSSNITVANNIIQNTGGGYDVVYVDPGASAIITNNTILGTLNSYTTINNSTFNNNILNISGAVMSGSNNSMNNNISNVAQLDTTNHNAHNNQINVNMGIVFVGVGSTDGQYKLKAGSSAIGAGFSGEDCGAFGGSDPYVLSGMPTVPSVYFFAAPTSGSGTLPVHVKIKSNK